MPVRESGAKRSRTRRFMSAPPYAEGGEMQGGGGRTDLTARSSSVGDVSVYGFDFPSAREQKNIK